LDLLSEEQLPTGPYPGVSATKNVTEVRHHAADSIGSQWQFGNLGSVESYGTFGLWASPDFQLAYGEMANWEDWSGSICCAGKRVNW
jgi:hypothetical protein